MKRLVAFFIGLIACSQLAVAQKYGYVDTQYILENIPEYTEAQEQLNKLSEQWQTEIEEKFALVEKKHREYETEAILLPDEIKKQRQKEIDELRLSAMELQKQRFGVGGDLFKKREELIKPIQDRIFEAIQQVAVERQYSFIFDKANQSNLLYADPKFDISDAVLQKMGIKVAKRN
ncbi:MAG: OmpH family outer membrane protein [Bacteroidetes bacterium]|nr:OmpH family outer membrane protein [Bacteroidota bacterium]